ncbi:MAG TPA: NADH:flavin oxidoreductase/NADH oxidase [Spirochaetia bacterium]|nr:NADH:flavin oxidoreductase/NADH oxidase [Spirochaetia bacterium]
MLLFEPLTIRELTVRNRIFVSPMCQYSSDDGFATDWHLVHLGSRAVGGAGIVITEATAVLAEGRISSGDLGIWKDEHVEALSRVARFVTDHGAQPGIQLAHAGRKASTQRPWESTDALKEPGHSWSPIYGPVAEPFSASNQVPVAMSLADIRQVVGAFRDAAIRARSAGFTVAEIHAAHGYLLHEFLSPLANRRTDQYGGSFENRVRFLREVVAAVRAVWPEDCALFVRISGTDWKEGGWTADDSVELAALLKNADVDLIDVSSGGIQPDIVPPAGPGYQTLVAERIRREAGILTGTVGLITDAVQAEHVLRTGQADAVLIGRAILRDPYWPLTAARELGGEIVWPNQYLRAKR